MLSILNEADDSNQNPFDTCPSKYHEVQPTDPQYLREQDGGHAQEQVCWIVPGVDGGQSGLDFIRRVHPGDECARLARVT
mgnify:CR=1 FL=1